MGKAVHRADTPESGTYVADTGDDGTGGCDYVFGEKCHNQAADSEYDDVKNKESHNAGHDVGMDTFVIMLHIDNSVGMDNPFEFDE